VSAAVGAGGTALAAASQVWCAERYSADCGFVAELGEVTAVVATGGLAPIVVPESRRITHHDPELTLTGLRLVYAKNT